MSIQVREFSLEDMDVIFRIYGNVFGEDRLERWKMRWRWQFQSNPAASETPSSMWVAETEEGKILGFIGSFPIRLQVGDRQIVSSSSGDLMVLQEARRMGLGEKLSRAYLESTQTLATGFGYAPGTGRIYRRLGYKPVFCEPIHIRPMDIKQMMGFLEDAGQVPSFFGNKVMWPFMKLLGGLTTQGLRLQDVFLRPHVSPALRIERVTEAGEEFDDLWQRVRGEFCVVVVRDRRFVDWRCFHDPVFQHHLLAARDVDGRLQGYLDVRVSELRGMEPARIMDLFCAPSATDVITSLLGRALEVAAKEQVGVISCLGLHPGIRRIVKKYLYLRARRWELPALLYNKESAELGALVFEADNWHLTHADGDEGFAP